MVRVKFINTEADYIEASIAYSYGSKRASFDLIIEVIALIIGIVLWSIYGFSWFGIFIIAASIVGLIIRILGYYILPRIRFKSEPKYKDEYLLEFEYDGIRFKTNSLDSKLDWTLYNKVIETSNLYILVYGRYNFSIIPKRALLTDSDRSEFNDLTNKYIKERVVKA